MPPKIYKKKSLPPKISDTAKYLVIVESPSKCPKIEHYLGPEYACIASKGHLRTINGLKAIATKSNFEPTFDVLDEKKDHIKIMKDVIAKFKKENIILATDDDREGEAISWHICQLFDLPVETTKRILFHEITKSAIQAAINSPTIINMNLVKAQHARQVLDIIVGYKISPFLWKYLYNNKSNSLSAGRCQTPALRLVYDNEKEKNGDLETRYKTSAEFFSTHVLFQLNHEFSDSKEVLEFMDKSKTFKYKLSVSSPKKSVKSPPKPLHTSRLLQLASSTLHIPPKETMNICQKLYQNGYITYMRTESSQYSKTFLEQARKHISKEWKEADVGDLDKLEIKDASNPHEAIRVTQLEIRALPDADDKRVLSVYKLIWRTTIETCMSEAVYSNHSVSITAPFDKSYEHVIEVPISLGWKNVGEKIDITRTQNESNGMLSYMKSIAEKNAGFSHNFIESAVVVRNRHSHYTEASLIQKLEELGIGRPSTFATIVETIQERGYVKRMDLEGTKIQCKDYKLTNNNLEEQVKEKIFGNEKSKLVIQPVGIITVEFLLNYFQDTFSYEYTKKMEDDLDIVSSGKEADWSSICKKCYSEIKEQSKSIANISKQSYPIMDGYDLIFEKYGPAIKHALEEGTIEYLPVKKDLNIDLDKLKNKDYSLDDLLEIQNSCLGEYNGENVFIKNGRYGPYIEWGSNKESIKSLNKKFEEITLEDIKQFMETSPDKEEKNVLRKLNEVLSVRKGKFGPYVYYKALGEAKPQFLNIKKFPEGFLTCQTETLIRWLRDTYNLQI